MSSDEEESLQNEVTYTPSSIQWNFSRMEEFTLRQKTRDFLRTYISNTENIFTIESFLYKLAIEQTRFNRLAYIRSVQEFHSLLYTHHPKDILERIQRKETGYQSPEYSIFLKMEQDEIDKLNTKIETIEGLYTCKRCKQSKTSQYGIQLRSSDEPMTIFISCLNPECRHKWREG